MQYNTIHCALYNNQCNTISCTVYSGQCNTIQCTRQRYSNRPQKFVPQNFSPSSFSTSLVNMKIMTNQVILNIMIMMIRLIKIMMNQVILNIMIMKNQVILNNHEIRLIMIMMFRTQPDGGVASSSWCTSSSRASLSNCRRVKKRSSWWLNCWSDAMPKIFTIHYTLQCTPYIIIIYHFTS